MVNSITLLPFALPLASALAIGTAQPTIPNVDETLGHGPGPVVFNGDYGRHVQVDDDGHIHPARQVYNNWGQEVRTRPAPMPHVHTVYLEQPQTVPTPQPHPQPQGNGNSRSGDDFWVGCDGPNRPGGYASCAPNSLPFGIVNRHTGPVSINHVIGAGSPRPTGAPIGQGVIEPGETSTFWAPHGYSGSIFYGDAAYPLQPQGGSSQFEASFVVPGGANANGIPVSTVDVSYVTGFSLPGVCWCGPEEEVVTGCNKDLFSLGTACPDFDEDSNSCLNPYHGSTPTGSAHPFFAPCQKKAYTFPSDDLATSFGVCQHGIMCCVGEDCPANKRV